MAAQSVLGQSPQHVRFESFGVVLEVEVGSDLLLPEVLATLPPGWTATDAPSVDGRLAIRPSSEDLYEVTRDDMALSNAAELPLAIGILDAQIRMSVATHVPTGAFVHAGVVALDGRLVVIPGRSFAGKTTLVRALLRRGATYFSDEFAVLDDDGLVHPYAKPLSVRLDPHLPAAAQQRTAERRADELGAPVGSGPLPIAAIAAVRFQPAASWAVSPRSPAQGALLLMANTLTGRSDPQKVLPLVRTAAAGARVVEGLRGEVEEAADAITALLAA